MVIHRVLYIIFKHFNIIVDLAYNSVYSLQFTRYIFVKLGNSFKLNFANEDNLNIFNQLLIVIGHYLII